jgi:molybdate transport system substrate-binding protein
MRSALLAVALAPVPESSVAAETVHLYAAGSLKAAMTDITREFEAKSGGAVTVETVFGPSGLLRERIEKGGGRARVCLRRYRTSQAPG